MKNILWVTNILLPEASVYLGKKPMVIGGWLTGLLDVIKNNTDYKIAVASVSSNIDFVNFEKENITYFILPNNKPITSYNSSLELEWEKLYNVFQPDLVHIHGTEYCHGLALMNSYPKLNYIISIQGLVSVYERYYLGGISFKDVILNITLRDLLTKGNLLIKKNDFKKRGQIEKEYLLKAGNVIGRTDWDKSHSFFINKKINYYHCNEVLRSIFYNNEYSWDLNSVEKHSIFLSQATYPIKGLHKVLSIVNFLKEEFPDLKVYVGGPKIEKSKNVLGYLKKTNYKRYILKLLKKFNLFDTVEFLGNLSAEEMAYRYSKSHVFICPSSIENSPNSVGEAQIIGTPCISSYVGGVSNMITHNETGVLYRFEEVEMLAYYITQIFKNKNFSNNLSNKAKIESSKRHNTLEIVNKTIQIYNDVINRS
jgi:glycosyltransferase involved in cell wall biosynthesis